MLNDVITDVLIKNDLVTGFSFIGLLVFISYKFSDWFTHGRIHGSAIAITLGLVLAYFGGKYTGGSEGLADIPIFTGIGIMGNARKNKRRLHHRWIL